MALLDSKFQPWGHVKEQLEHALRTVDPEEHSVMVPYGLQLAHTFHHPHIIRCMTFYHCTNGNIFVTQLDTGVINEVYIWSLSTLPDEEVKCQRIKINNLMSKIIFVPQHRVFVGFSPDVTLHVFNDVINNCMELTEVHCSETILCMVYNEDMDELVTGGRGFLQAWKMTNVEVRDPLVRGRPIESEITEDDWVRDVRLDRKRRQLAALCDEGIHIINYITNMEMYCIKNWHASALTCFVFYRKLEYCITASMDGAIKVWNAVVFKEVHQFIGHYASVTGLVIHPADPLLISSSKDGTVRIWRLDTFELTHRLNVGEKVLGMKLANPNQLYYYTLHDIKVWNFNLFHHLFTPIRSCVHKLARIVSPSSPSRILCAAEDGGVRLISAVSGTELTIIYPMPSYQVLTDIVYDPKNSLIFTVLEMGDVLIFDSSTNPCQAKELLVPMMPEESVVCLALVKLDCANGREETPTSDYLIFSGLASGQISLLECQAHSMKYPLQAHGGAVLALECSHGIYGEEIHNHIASGARLMSSGSDRFVKIWEVGIGDTLQAIRLVCLKVIACTVSPCHISMLGNILCTVLPTNVVEMYELCDADGTSTHNIPPMHMAKYVDANMFHGIKHLKHLRDHDHTKQITALCSCPSLGVFATTSNDGSLKIWDLTNTLVRELWFDHTLRSVCFANDRGDLLVGFQNHISHVSIASYLPLSYMELLVQREFDDGIIEEPFQFNPDLPLWFNLRKIPTFPTDLLIRQHVRKKLPQLRKQLLGETISKKEEGSEENAESEEVFRSSIELLLDVASILQVPKQSAGEMVEIKGHVAVEHKKKTSKPPKQESSRLVTRVLSCQGNGDKAPPTSVMEPAAGESKKTEKDLKKESEMDTPHQTQDEEEKVDVPMDTDEGLEMEGGEETEKEPKIKLPIAPDGYIPNSVIRRIVQPPKPPPPPTPPGGWKLKDVPTGEVHFATASGSEYEDHEPYMWASSEESSRGEVTPVTTPSPPPSEPFVYQPRKPRRQLDVEAEETVQASKDKRKMSLKMVGKLVLSHPGHSEERGKAVSSKKSKRKGRGINREASALRKHGKRGTLEDISQDGKEDIEEEEEEGGTEQGPVDALLQKISDNYWYPKGLKMNIYSTVKTLLSLLDGSSNEHYKYICDYLLELNRLVGFGGTLLDSIISKYLRDMKSSLFETRLNAIRTLTGLKDNRPIVVLSLLNSMADEEDVIQKEAADAIDKLAGISTKNAMEDYLANIGILKSQPPDPVDDLARRFRRETRQGENRLHATAANLLDRRESSSSHLPNVSYSPDMIKGWLSTYLGDQDLYQYKPKGLKTQTLIQKKKRRMALAYRERRPKIVEGEIMAFEEDEELSDYGSEEEYEDEEEDKEGEKSEEEEEEEELEGSLDEMESFARRPEEHHPQQLKMNKHQAMMKAKEMAAEREKTIMERKAKEKMRKHIAEYEEAMKRKRRKQKHILPYHPLFHKYYSQPKKAGEFYQRTGREIKALLKSVSSVQDTEAKSVSSIQETEATISVADMRSSHDSHLTIPEQMSYQSIGSDKEETPLPAIFQQISHLPIEEEEEETIQEHPIRKPVLPIAEEDEKEITPEHPIRKPVRQQVSSETSQEEIQSRRIRKGMHFYLDRRRWWEDEEMIAEGWGTTCRPKFNMPVDPHVDSGVGESMLTGTSQLLTGTSTNETLCEPLIRTKMGVSGGIDGSRPRSNLTMANVRRHELLSAHKDTKEELPQPGIVPKENWRNFFLLPTIQEKRKHYDALHALQNGNLKVDEETLEKQLKIKCVPSRVVLTPGSSNDRILHDITVGSKGKGHGMCGRGDIAKIPPLGKQGVTGYGALQMTWSNMVPRCPTQSRKGHCVTMGTRRRDLSLGTSQKNREDWRRQEDNNKMWLRTQMLYPSLFALQEIDFIKRQLSDSRPIKTANLFEWETPLPMISLDQAVRQDNDLKAQPCRLCDKEERSKKIGTSLPSIIQSENGVDDEVPIVPRNSIASTTCDPWTLPRINIRKKQTSDGVKMATDEPLKEISGQS